MSDITEYENTIYHDPQRYDDQYWWKKNDVEFWKNIYNNQSGNEVLELGCGTGRLATPIIREGAKYTGVEISKEFTEHAEQKIIQEGLAPNIQTADFRNFNLHKKYDIIFIGFNTFLHLLTNKDAMNFLSSVKKHMHSDTLFYIDILVPDPLFIYRDDKRIKNLEYIDSQTGKITYVDEICNYNSKTEINKVTWIYYTEKNKDEKEYHFSMRMYFPDTMNRLIIDSGLYIQNMWGNYESDDFNENSELQIYECIL